MLFLQGCCFSVAVLQLPSRSRSVDDKECNELLLSEALVVLIQALHILLLYLDCSLVDLDMGIQDGMRN
jgi:hypothetical protein